MRTLNDLPCNGGRLRMLPLDSESSSSAANRHSCGIPVRPGDLRIPAWRARVFFPIAFDKARAHPRDMRIVKMLMPENIRRGNRFAHFSGIEWRPLCHGDRNRD